MDIVFHIEKQLLDEDGDEFLTYVAAHMNSEGCQGVIRLTPCMVDMYQQQFAELQDAANDDFFDCDDGNGEILDQGFHSLCEQIESSLSEERRDVRERPNGSIALQFLAKRLDEIPDDLAYQPVAHDLCDLLDTMAKVKECEQVLADLGPDYMWHA